MSAISTFLKNTRLAWRVLRDGMRSSRTQRQLINWMNERSAFRHMSATSFHTDGDYFISTDQGVFRLFNGKLIRVTQIPAFGIAVRNDDIYLATWTDRESWVIKGNRKALLTPGMRYEFETLYRIPVRSHSSRVHQISVTDDYLLLANTARNTLTKIDRHDGRWIADIAPIRCAYGAPITVDHNHINSVTALGNVVLFVAFQIGMRAMIGVCGTGLVRGYAYPNLGVHDVHIVGRRILVSDSYRFNEDDCGGMLVDAWQPFDRNFFDSSPQYFVRGLAGIGDEMLIGSSFAGDRKDRFKGEGSILLANGNRIVNQTNVPSGQIYDIIHTDGRSFIERPELTSFDEICADLQANLGDPVMEMSLEEALVSEKGQQFSDSDRGDVPELFTQATAETVTRSAA